MTEGFAAQKKKRSVAAGKKALEESTQICRSMCEGETCAQNEGGGVIMREKSSLENTFMDYVGA